ncbi:MAG: HAD-IIIC family phosphatase [Isosphaeraceae bacterium]
MTTESISDTAKGDRAAGQGVNWPRDTALSAALLANRHALSQELVGGIAGWEKYASQIKSGPDRDDFLRREIYAFVDYLRLYLRTGDETYKHLYIGEKLKQLHHGDENREQRQERARNLLEHDEQAILKVIGAELTSSQQARLRHELQDISRVVLGESATTLKVLLVGDCLYLDIQAFLTVQCLEDGIGLDFSFAVSKNGPILRNELKTLSSRPFDLIFYSPFTYEFSPALSQFFRANSCLAGTNRICATAYEVMSDVESTLRILASRFECPVFVHNTAMVRRHDGTLRERLKTVLTRRSRRIARDLVNRRVAAAITQLNTMSYEHLFLIDEMELLTRHSEDDLGRKFYDSDLQHPAVLGLALSGVYRDLIAAHVSLAGRKLVVCDLDNTLWDGVIGEGAVIPYLDRQRILQELKAKGIVLAVNSKNDPRNVQWNGGLLKESDFVDLQVNWDSKITNMKRIRENLNLKYKDYVFIDDRGDQLELVGSALPEIRLLDATSERSWRLLQAWAAMLPEQTEGDRTQLYHERQARDSFVSEIGTEDQEALFTGLEIRVTLRKAARSDLQRVTELINRTNQFNLAGSRTTFREISQWHDDPAYALLVAEAADKFGPMGLISAAVLKSDSWALSIPIFVLSCRVFGYGIEAVMLNTARRLSFEGDGPPRPIRGAFTETPHNAPCKSMYPDHGFIWDGQVWVLEGGEIPPDPVWLTVDNRVAPAREASTRRHESSSTATVPMKAAAEPTVSG